MVQEQIKKTRISEIGKNKQKITIADELEVESHYHMEPPLTIRQLSQCWLDPSELDVAYQQRWKMFGADRKESISYPFVELLQEWLKPEALSLGIVKFVKESGFSWTEAKQRVLRRFNLTDLVVSSMSQAIHEIVIKSRQPLYDQNAHANRVRNVLHAVHIHYPHIHFEHEGCMTSGSCPIGLQEALRKLAEESHGKVQPQ